MSILCHKKLKLIEKKPDHKTAIKKKKKYVLHDSNSHKGLLMLCF